MKGRRTWLRSIRTAALYFAVDLPEEVLRRADTPGESLSAADMYRLWRALLDESPSDAIPVIVGENIRLSEFGVLAAASFAAPSLTRLLDYYRQYMPLFAPEFALGRSATEDGELVTFEPVVQPFHWGAAIALMAVFCRFYRQITDPWQRLSRIEFACPAPQLLSAYREGFRAELAFDCEAFRIHLSAGTLDEPLPGGNRRLFDTAWALTREELERELPSISRRIRELVDAMPPTSALPDLVAVARQLHLSPRTVQRRLASEGQSFSAVLEGVRLDRATRALRRGDGRPLSEIAQLCGFEDQAAFSRFFKRHMAQTPSEFRARSEAG